MVNSLAPGAAWNKVPIYHTAAAGVFLVWSDRGASGDFMTVDAASRHKPRWHRRSGLRESLAGCLDILAYLCSSRILTKEKTVQWTMLGGYRGAADAKSWGSNSFSGRCLCAIDG